MTKKTSTHERAGLQLPVSRIAKHLSMRRSGTAIVSSSAYAQFLLEEVMKLVAAESEKSGKRHKDGSFRMLPRHLDGVAAHDKTGIWTRVLQNVVTHSALHVRPTDELLQKPPQEA